MRPDNFDSKAWQGHYKDENYRLISVMNKIIVNQIQGCVNMWYITTKWSFVPGMKVVLTSENLSIQCTTLTVKRKSMMGKNSTWQKLIHTRRRQWHPTPILLPGKSMDGGTWWAAQESDTTEQLHFYFSLSCIGEGNGNPLQYSCLENPRDSGVWWAAVYGVSQSRTWQKWLSSSSSSSNTYSWFFFNLKLGYRELCLLE